MLTVYIELKESVQVKNEVVHIADVASIYCTDSEKKKVIDELELLRFHKGQQEKQVVGILFLIQAIEKRFGDLLIQPIGITDVIVEYVGNRKKGFTTSEAFRILKTIGIALICFFGGAFTIMSFHTDCGLNQMLMWIYEYVTGVPSDGFTLVEVGYSIGLSLGIIIFFNHIGKKRITRDFTPIEVAMRMYEQDVNNSMASAYEREGKKIDVT